VHLAALRGLRGGRDASLGKASERGFVGGDVGACFRGGAEFVGESIGKRRSLFVELLEFSFVGFGEVGPGVYEVIIVVLNQAERLRVKFERCALFVDRSYAGEELSVEMNEVRVGSEP